MIISSEDYLKTCDLAAFMTREEIEDIKEKYPETKPVEYVTITDNLKTIIDDVYSGMVPIDMFLCQHIPVPDLLIHVCNDKDNDVNIAARVFVQSKEKILDRIKDLKMGKIGIEGMVPSIVIGLLRMEVYGSSMTHTIKLLYPIYYFENPQLTTATCGLIVGFDDTTTYTNFKNEYFEHNTQNLVAALSEQARTMLIYWHMVQTMLLNPLVVPYVRRETVINTIGSINNRKRHNKKPAKRYIKRIMINTDQMNVDGINISYEKPKRQYTESIWWVSGHYRHYKSGKEVWIDGYWKGSGRFEAKLPEPREREIVTPDFMALLELYGDEIFD